MKKKKILWNYFKTNQPTNQKRKALLFNHFEAIQNWRMAQSDSKLSKEEEPPRNCMPCACACATIIEFLKLFTLFWCVNKSMSDTKKLKTILSSSWWTIPTDTFFFDNLPTDTYLMCSNRKFLTKLFIKKHNHNYV